ncbi:MAG: HI0074 family nucleotidyltransferase substrate-binding subunit [Pseudobdellovibrionaceae bacterium]
MSDDHLFNFQNSLKQLKLFCEMPIQNDRDRAGIIQAFEFTFEQSWKAIQKKTKDQGVEIVSPKQAYMFAIQSRWIAKEDEKLWIGLINDRNLTTHTYKEQLAKKIVEKILQQYLFMLEKLFEKLK